MIAEKVTPSDPADEEQIVRKAQEKPEAFKPLYDKYYKRIFLFVHHRVGDKSLTADITSQVFLKAMTHLKSFQFRGVPFSSWLFRIALNECHDFFRKSKRYRLVAIDETAVEKLHEELISETDLNALQEKLPMILEKLTIDELQLIELRFFELRPFKEVADIAGISETYAKVRVYRILEKMKKLFLEKR